MNLYYYLYYYLFSLKVFLSQKEVKLIIICTATGAILQILAKKYLESHPELLKDASVTKKKDRRPRLFSARGGALIQISAINTLNLAINLLAKKGIVIGLAAGTLPVLKKIPSTAISTYLRNSFPQNLPHLEKSKCILVDEKKLYLDQCDQTLEFLFKILKDEKMPFKEKQRLAHSIFTKYLNLETVNGRITFVICIISALYILSNQNPSGFSILLKNLIKAIKEGRISKAIGRSIVRRLQKKGIPIDPELVDVVSS